MSLRIGGTAPACAACKFQRRKCSPHCPLAPYFPVSKTKDFENVHRLFGVSNVTKTILKLQTKTERDEAMTSIIYEADMRSRYPVLGCTGAIINLYNKLNAALHELSRIEKVRRSLINNLSAEGQIDDDDEFGGSNHTFHQDNVVFGAKFIPPGQFKSNNFLPCSSGGNANFLPCAVEQFEFGSSSSGGNVTTVNSLKPEICPFECWDQVAEFGSSSSGGGNANFLKNVDADAVNFSLNPDGFFDIHSPMDPNEFFITHTPHSETFNT